LDKRLNFLLALFEGSRTVRLSCHSLAMVALVVVCAGCSGTGGSLGTLQTQNRSLLEQNRAQIAEIENLKDHSRRLGDELIEAERQLSLLEEQIRPRQDRLAAEQGNGASPHDRSARQDKRQGENPR
jgi:hypothetical protein